MRPKKDYCNLRLFLLEFVVSEKKEIEIKKNTLFKVFVPVNV